MNTEDRKQLKFNLRQNMQQLLGERPSAFKMDMWMTQLDEQAKKEAQPCALVDYIAYQLYQGFYIKNEVDLALFDAIPEERIKNLWRKQALTYPFMLVMKKSAIPKGFQPPLKKITHG